MSAGHARRSADASAPRRQRPRGLPAAVLGTGLLAACSLAPTYQVPRTAPVTQYKELGDWLPAQPADDEPRSTWWERFGDPRLDELERQLQTSNPDLRAAVARLDQAIAQAQRTRSQLYPSVGASASATRERASGNAPLAKELGTLGIAGGAPYNDFVTGLNLNWEIDLFGRLRNSFVQARSQAQQSAADRAAVQLSLQAQLASDYFTVVGDDDTVKLLTDTVRDYTKAYEVIRNRYNEGIAAATDVDQADTQLQNARAQLFAVERERAQFEHAIAVLVGQPASTFSLAPGTLGATAPPINYALPSTLLERRPDVASAERAVAAANAGIGVARAAWFPVFSLTSGVGFESVYARNWVSAPSRFWSVGPAGQVPLLDFGARAAANRQARGAYDEAVANYRKTTLTAYQEVEDALASLHHTSEELLADEAAYKSATSSAHHSDERYTAGVADYLEVTSTHTAALQAARAALSARIALLNAAVSLVRASGGGWTREDLPAPMRMVSAPITGAPAPRAAEVP